MRQIILKLACLIFCFLPVMSYAGGKHQDTVSFSPEISRVVTGGLWQHQNRHGTYRVLVRSVGWEHIKNLAYIQWLVEDDDKQTTMEWITTPIKELNSDTWTNIANISLKPGKQTTILKIDYFVRGSEKKETLNLKLGAAGEYAVIR